MAIKITDVVSNENFSGILNLVKARDNQIAVAIQALVVFGMVDYDENHNSNRLTEILSTDFKSVRTKAVKEYIENFTDLVWTKKLDGSAGFKREAKEGYEFSIPETTWYEWSNAGKITTVDAKKNLASLITSIESGMDVTKSNRVLKVGTDEYAGALLAHLKAFNPEGAQAN